MVPPSKKRMATIPIVDLVSDDESDTAYASAAEEVPASSTERRASGMPSTLKRKRKVAGDWRNDGIQRSHDWLAMWAEPVSTRNNEALGAEKFWREELHRRTGAKPRCLSCKRGKRTTNKVVTGFEEEELAPCGCLWKHALIEEFVDSRGLTLKSEKGEPLAMGVARAVCVSFFETVFGELNATKVNARTRKEWVAVFDEHFEP